jgi:hypothetical protein
MDSNSLRRSALILGQAVQAVLIVGPLPAGLELGVDAVRAFGGASFAEFVPTAQSRLLRPIPF